MSTDVNKIIETAVGEFRSILTNAVTQASEETRDTLIKQFSAVVDGSKLVTVKASRVAAKAKTKKTTAKKKASVKAKAKHPAAKKAKKSGDADKPKRKVSEATRKKLAANLKKARDAKAANAKASGKAKTKAKSKAKAKK